MKTYTFNMSHVSEDPQVFAKTTSVTMTEHTREEFLSMRLERREKHLIHVQKTWRTATDCFRYPSEYIKNIKNGIAKTTKELSEVKSCLK